MNGVFVQASWRTGLVHPAITIKELPPKKELDRYHLMHIKLLILRSLSFSFLSSFFHKVKEPFILF